MMAELSKLRTPTYRLTGDYKVLPIAPVLSQRRKSDTISLRQRILVGE